MADANDYCTVGERPNKGMKLTAHGRLLGRLRSAAANAQGWADQSERGASRGCLAEE